MADALREWLPAVLHGIDPWVSDKDIGKGTEWFPALQGMLSKTQFCLICVTPENVHSPWIYYEVGAIALGHKDARIYPFLVGVDPKELGGGPLTQWQCTTPDREDTWLLIEALNKDVLDSRNSHSKLKEAYDTAWPDLDAILRPLSEAPVKEEPKDTSDDPEQTAWTTLSDEAKTMLVAVSKDDQGTLIDGSDMGGTEFLTGGKNLIPDQSPRTIARWKSALSQLETNELIEEIGEDVFKITDDGFETADKIREAEGRSRPIDAVPREKINQQETADNLRRTIFSAEEDWTTEKESDPKNTDDGKLIIQRLGESLHRFRDHLANSIPEGIGRIFDNVIRDAKLFQRRGQSSSTFWRKGDHIIKSAEKLGIDVALAFAADEDPTYSGPYKGYSAEELKEVLVQFLKGRESEAFEANLGSLDPPSGSFMAGELIHFRQLDEKLHLPSGTSRTLLREAAREFKLKILKATSNTIQFE